MTIVRNLSQNTIEKMRAKRLAEHKRLEDVVLNALRRLGGSFSGRVMVFRKELSESLREAQIKETLKRLVDAGTIRVIGEKNSHKGNTYEVIQ